MRHVRAIVAASRFAPEVELLLCCARSWPDEAARERTRALLSATIDWDRLVRLAQYHRVLPLLQLNLDRIDSPRVPAHVLERLREDQQANAARNLQLAGEMFGLLAALEQAGIRAIVFKGLVLAARAYGDLARRDAGDIDLLIRRDDVVRAVKLLEGLGHRAEFPTSTPEESGYLRGLAGASREAYLKSHCEHHLVSRAGGVNVDLHWAIALREFCLPLDTEGLWLRATTTRVAGRAVPALCDEDLLLVLCVNGTKDCWERLDRVADVSALIGAAPDLSWSALEERARRAGATRMLRLGLSLAVDLLDARLPREVARRIRRDAALVALTSEVCRRLVSDPPGTAPAGRTPRAVFHLRTRERWRDRIQYCAAHLRPSVGDWAGFQLPAPFAFVHYLLRPLRLAARHAIPPGASGRGATPAARPSDRACVP